MTQDNDTDATDAQGTGSGADEDSPVIKELRKQVKDLQKELKQQPSRSDLEAELRSQLEREMAVESKLETFGVPRGIRSVVEEQLGDAEATDENVAEALKAIGFELDDDGGAPEKGADADSQAASDLAAVSNLSAKVRSSAKGGTPESDLDRISKASSPEELAAIAAEGDFLQNNY